MTANEAIAVFKQVKSRGELFSDEMIEAISVAITALESIGKDPSKDIILYKSYLQRAVDDFRTIGSTSHFCKIPDLKCGVCPMNNECCDKWVLEDEVMELINR